MSNSEENIGGASVMLQPCEHRFGYHFGQCARTSLVDPNGHALCDRPLTDSKGVPDGPKMSVPFMPEPFKEPPAELVDAKRERLVITHGTISADALIPLRFGFSLALIALREGKKVARTGWNGRGMWVALQTPDANSKMSLPYLYIEYPEGHPAYPNGSRVPWVASQMDLLACDWEVVD